MAEAYATLVDADEYFATRLHSNLWGTKPTEDWQKALYTATRHIDRLNFQGEKAAAYIQRQTYNVCIYTEIQEKAIADAGLLQALEFPRGSDSTVPEDVKIACLELAYSLMDGKDPEIELENLSQISQGFSSVRNTQDRSFVFEHLSAGIVSPVAWRLLRPFVRDDRSLRVTRVS